MAISGKKWQTRIAKSEKFLQHATEHGRKVYDRYKDTRTDGMPFLKRANIFYSNVNTLKESLFNSMPKPDVSRLHKGDFQDDVARVAALILQKALEYEVATAKDFKTAVRSAILDRLVPGLGTVWIRFDVDMDAAPTLEDDSGGSTDEPTEPPEQVPVEGTELLSIETVYWEDFIYEPARTWDKVTWVGRKLDMTKSEITEEWGAELAQQIEGVKNNDTVTPKEITEGKFRVYEIWDKANKEVLHIAKGLDEPLDRKADPYAIDGFFPCPMPLLANPTTTAYLPITDYYIAQDQYNQLDTLYARIALLIDAVKVAGCYDASAENTIGRLLQGQENKLIPVDNWAMYAEAGGAKGLIDWYPVEVVVNCLAVLQQQFEAVKGVLQEVSGMADIVRGDTNQYETAAAQQIKAQLASVRMNGYQRDVSEFVSSILNIMAEMILNLYSDQKLAAIVGELSPPDMELVPQAVELLRNDFLRSCKVSIQTDSLTQADWGLEKQQRMDLIANMSQFLQQAVPATQSIPELGVLMMSMLKFSVAGFKGAAEIEGIMDQQLDQMLQAQQSQAGQPKPPSPEEQKAQADLQMQQTQMQMDQQSQQHEMEMAQMDAQLKQQEMQQKMGIDQQMAQIDMAMKQQQLDHSKEMAEMDIQIKLLELQIKQKEAVIDMQTNMVKHEQDLEQKAEQHEQSLEQSGEE